jgi:hypothetical protein
MYLWYNALELALVQLFRTNLCLFQPFQPAPTPVPPLAGWMSNPPAVTHPAVSGGAIGFGTPTNPGTCVIFVAKNHIMV